MASLLRPSKELHCGLPGRNFPFLLRLRRSASSLAGLPLRAWQINAKLCFFKLHKISVVAADIPSRAATGGAAMHVAG